MRNCLMPIITHNRQIYVAQCWTEILNTVKVEPTFWHGVFPLGASDDNGVHKLFDSKTDIRSCNVKVFASSFSETIF
jgi:hypothetical protein